MKAETKIKRKIKKEAENQIKKAGPVVIISIILCLILGLSVGVATYFAVTKNDTFEIVGNNDVVLNVGDSYIENGAKAVAFGKDISKEIIIEGNVDTTKVGVYVIKYKVNSLKYKDIIKVRYVTVLEVE